MTSRLARLLFGAILVVAVLPTSPAEADYLPPRCAPMTDSITRLYNAYLHRQPDPGGFDHWVGAYSSGRLSLEEISEAFARSPEFAERGLVSDATYTNWVYRTMLQRDPTADELDHWVRALGGGYPRGSVMLPLTESSDYVQKTGTAVPLAGYQQWYPKGTHWYCDHGSRTVAVNPLLGEVWADYYFVNRGANTDEIGLWTLEADRRRNVTMRRGPLAAGFTDYNWDGVFSGDGDYGHFIEVEASSTTNWIIVFYPRSIGEDRPGWQPS